MLLIEIDRRAFFELLYDLNEVAANLISYFILGLRHLTDKYGGEVEKKLWHGTVAKALTAKLKA